MSRILFLGTAGDSSVVGKQLRSSGGMILQFEDDLLYLNPGPGSLVRAKQYGINLRNITGILVSDNQMKHANDINAVISAMTHDGLDPKGVLITNKTVIEGDEANQGFLQERERSFVERIIALSKGERAGIKDIEIKGITAKNNDKNALGFKIKTENFTITYTNHTSLDKKIMKNYENSDILILDVDYPMGGEHSDGLSSDNVIEILKNTTPKLAIITGFGIKMLNADPLQQAREIQKASKIQTMAATDGLVITPENYLNF